MNDKVFVGCLLALSLVACAQMSLRDDYGSSVDNNSQAQIIDKEAGNKDYEHSFDGQKAAMVLDRYRSDTGDVDNERLIQDMSD